MLRSRMRCGSSFSSLVPLSPRVMHTALFSSKESSSCGSTKPASFGNKEIEYKISFRPVVGVPAEMPQLCSLKRLEVKVCSIIGRRLLFFTSLMKASPHLCEFRI